MSVHDLRNEYSRATLDEANVEADPIRQFHGWFEEALAAKVPEPHAMALATASPDGHPSVRIVLLRGYDDRGFTFFTNYESRKGRELAANPHAALVLYWHDLERQVRIEGTVLRIAPEESDAYFNTRPEGARLGAWASPQSDVIPGRGLLEERCREIERQYPDGRIPRPGNWGGFRVVPGSVEFWQGRPNRLHDRLRYLRDPQGAWRVERLAP